MWCFQKVGPLNIVAKSSLNVDKYCLPEVTFMDMILAIWAVSFTYTFGMALLFCYPFLFLAQGCQLHRNQEVKTWQFPCPHRIAASPLLSWAFTLFMYFSFFIFLVCHRNHREEYNFGCYLKCFSHSTGQQESSSGISWQPLQSFWHFHTERFDSKNAHNQNTPF